MRHERQIFDTGQWPSIQLVMEFTYFVSRVRHPHKDGGSRGNETFDVSHGHVERLHRATSLHQPFDCVALGATQRAGRQNGDVCGKVSVYGMEFTPEVLNPLGKFSF
jgi:hypothetical protein